MTIRDQYEHPLVADGTVTDTDIVMLLNEIYSTTSWDIEKIDTPFNFDGETVLSINLKLRLSYFEVYLFISDIISGDTVLSMPIKNGALTAKDIDYIMYTIRRWL